MFPFFIKVLPPLPPTPKKLTYQRACQTKESSGDEVIFYVPPRPVLCEEKSETNSYSFHSLLNTSLNTSLTQASSSSHVPICIECRRPWPDT